MSSAEFRVVYNGPSLSGHVMNVQQLGPALLAIGDLCQEANRVLNGEQMPPIVVNVKATHQGCFDIRLMLEHPKDVGILVGAGLFTAEELLKYIGLAMTTATSLWGFLKWKKGRRLKKENIKTDGKGNVTMNIKGDNNTVVFSHYVDELSKSPKARSALRRLVEPVKGEGIDSIEVLEGNASVNRATKEEVVDGYYDVIKEELGELKDPEPIQEFDVVLELRGVIFDIGKNWQFYMGEQLIRAEIIDEEFNNEVFEGGKRFGSGDKLKVRMSMEQTLGPDGKYGAYYKIIKVNNVIKAPEQSDFGL